jgi:predicted dehydrogenase
VRSFSWRSVSFVLVAGASMTLFGAGSRAPAAPPRAGDVRLMTVDPGHFHAALVQKEMYPGVAARVDVFAPLGRDLIGHLNRVASFNARSDNPTAWQLEIHTGPDFFERMLKERPGNVVILSGRNRVKIDRIRASVEAGLNVLADKPWILRSEDLPKMEQALSEAEAQGLVAYDIMTERFEITTIIQRALVNDRAVFGESAKGSEADPAVYMESVHYLMKTVAGAPNLRPVWFFDTSEQGEGLNDVGTHLVDLVQWTLFPEQGIDYRTDVRVLAAQRWPTIIPEADFARVTGESRFPEGLSAQVKQGRLEYYCNTLVSYALRGVHTKLNVIWDWEAPPGSGDTHFAFYRGTRSRIEVRQTKTDKYRPELYVVPSHAEENHAILTAVQDRIKALQPIYPGVAVEDRGTEIRVTIPDSFRVGHEPHFAEVTRSFLKYFRDPKTLPAWERPNMLAKYFVTTTGTELSRKSAPRVAPRTAPTE